MLSNNKFLNYKYLWHKTAPKVPNHQFLVIVYSMATESRDQSRYQRTWHVGESPARFAKICPLCSPISSIE